MSTPKGFDFAQGQAVRAAEDEGMLLEILGLDSEVMVGAEGGPVTMLVIGKYSARYRKAERAQTNRVLKAKRTKFDADLLAEQRADMAASCVLEWDGFFDDGVALECTRANVIRAFDVAPWIMEQVEAAIEDHAGFLKASSTS